MSSGARWTRPAPSIDYLCRCVEAAIKAGATTINLPDTVGYATPEEHYDLHVPLRERVPGATR
jgi:2-isopropylmalate synthase